MEGQERAFDDVQDSVKDFERELMEWRVKMGNRP